MSPSRQRDFRVATTLLDSPSAPRTAWAVAAGLGALLVVLVFAGQAGGSGPGSPAATAMAAAAAPAAAAATTDVPSATPLPRPTRIVPFVLQATADGPATFVSPNLGFAIPLLGDRGDVTGYWAEGGRLAEAGGVLTFPAGVRGPDGTFSHAVTVAVGSSADPAPVRLDRTTGRVVGIWEPSFVALIQTFALQTGTAGLGERIEVGDERGIRLEKPPGGGVVVLAMHGDRVYIITSYAVAAGDRSAAPNLEAMLRDFRFIDAAAGVSGGG